MVHAICKYGIIPIRYDFAVQLEISKWDVSYNEKFTIFTLMPQVLKFTRLKSYPLLVNWRKISFVAVRLAQYSCKIIAGFLADPRTLQQLGTPHNRFWLVVIHKNFGKSIKTWIYSPLQVNGLTIWMKLGWHLLNDLYDIKNLKNIL